jgi:hypothetical protein
MAAIATPAWYSEPNTAIPNTVTPLSVEDIRKRRPTLILAIAVLLVGVAIVFIWKRDRPVVWRTFAKSDFALTVDFPGTWRPQAFDDEVHYRFYGVLISNAGIKLAHPDLGPELTTGWDMTELPPDAVVVQVSHTLGPGNPPERSTDFPVSLDDARRVEVRDNYGAPQPRLWIPLKVAGGYAYQISVWIGEDAVSSDRAIAERIVESVKLR